MATAERDAAILGAEGQRQQQVQQAKGQAEALEIMSHASSAALQTVGRALQEGGGVMLLPCAWRNRMLLLSPMWPRPATQCCCPLHPTTLQLQPLQP